MRAILVLMLTLLVGDVATAETTAAAKFQSAVAKKVAPPFGSIGDGKWKSFCVCNPTDQVGVLESFNGIPTLGVTCTVPTFGAQGDYSGGGACYDWTPLPK